MEPASLTAGEDGPDWQIELRSEVPDQVQVMTFHAALHPDDTADAARAATATT